jgi:hypothetical protein
MAKIKYFIASLYINEVGAEVTYYAYKEGSYGLHRTPDINDPNIIYYDTLEEARKQKPNDSDSIHFRYV